MIFLVLSSILANEQLRSLDQHYFVDNSTILSDAFHYLYKFQEIQALQKNTFYLPQARGMANKNRGLKIMVYYKKVNVLDKLREMLKNSQNFLI